MAEIKRRADAGWFGDLRSGYGSVSSGSGALKNQLYSFATRFEDSPGTNPEELVAAAHAACYNMALANKLSTQGYRPEQIDTNATATLTRQPEGGFRITKIRLDVSGQVPNIDETTFAQLARDAEKECPISNALRGGPTIELVPALK
jgi:osmotically inducible protein OsmC